MHFTTLVVGANDGDELHDLLAPYQENNFGTTDKSYLEFYDIEDELRRRYETESEERIVMPDGRLLKHSDEEFVVPFKTADDLFGSEFTISTREIPDDLKRRKFPLKKLYKTFEAFADAYCGGRDPDCDQYGFWENPSAEWDWYVVGGRWSPFFKLKDGYEGVFGEPGVFGRADDDLEGRADHALKGDIDFWGMRNERAIDAAKTYDVVARVIERTPINESWDVIRASYCNLAGDGDRFEEAMTKYEEQPRVKTFTAFAETEEGRRLLGYSSQVDDFNATRTDYIQQHRHAAATTSAVVMNGHWYDSFGKDPQTWHSIYAKMLNQIPDSTYLTVVDCHR